MNNKCYLINFYLPSLACKNIFNISHPLVYRKMLASQIVAKQMKRRLLVCLFSISGLHPMLTVFLLVCLGIVFLPFPRDPGSRHQKEHTSCTVCLHWGRSSPGAPSLRETLPLNQSPKEKSGHWVLPHTSSLGPAVCCTEPPESISFWPYSLQML